jgi:ABC-type dipeptide/oligopeptide/nickel transport system permease subunit
MRLRRNPFFWVSISIIGLYFFAAILAATGLVASHFQDAIGPAYQAPGKIYLLGTDVLGRSVLARLIHGARLSLWVGFLSTGIAIPIGVLLGLVAGMSRRWADTLIVWLYTTLDAIPTLLLLLSLALLLPTGKGLVTVCLALGTTSWVTTCRIVRGEVMRQRELPYVRSARAIGVSTWRIAWRHVLPNLWHVVLVQASLVFVYAVKSEVILSYLGVGIVDRPSWGVMIDDARVELIGRGAWWQFAGATAALFILVLAFNLFSDALKEALDPRG